MRRHAPLQSPQHPDRLQPRVPLTPEDIIALKERIQYNKVQFSTLMEPFIRAVHHSQSVQQDYCALPARLSALPQRDHNGTGKANVSDGCAPS